MHKLLFRHLNYSNNGGVVKMQRVRETKTIKCQLKKHRRCYNYVKTV